MAVAATVAAVAGAGPVAADDDAPPGTAPASRAGGETTTSSSPTTTIAVVVLEPDEPSGQESAPDGGPEDETDSGSGDGGTATSSTAAATSTTAGPSSVETGSQDASVSGTAIAIATTGSNVVESSGTTGAGGSGGATDVATGPATAVGSMDATSVDQQVTTALSDSATASVNQVVIVFNIGAAFAISGANGAASSSGNGSVATGNATAVGNSSSNYVTQAATGDAGVGASDSVDQAADVSRVGVAVASSGGNLIVTVLGATPTGGAIDTGGASAVGNQSVTNVTQSATAIGSGTSSITIDQRAVVLNLGIALANSGLNSVGGLAQELITNPTGDTAQDLMSLLLPGILAANTASSGSAGGSVSTGNATAIGNRSTTLIDQSAVGTASGDGSVAISQQVVVANVGAAVADTGSNAIGGSGTQPAALDPDAAAAAAQLGAFVAAVLASIDGDDGAGTGSLSVALGDLLVMIDSAVSSADVDVAASSDGAGPSAKARQKTIVITLGAARSTSGDNITVSTSGGDAPTLELPDGVLPDGVLPDGVLPDSIVTGDALAENEGVTVVCQLDDAIGYLCLVPKPPDEPPPPLNPGDTVPDTTPGTTVPSGTPGAPDAPGVASQPAAMVGGPSPDDFIAIVIPFAALPASAAPAAVLPAQDLPTTGADVTAIAVLAVSLLALGGSLILLTGPAARRRRSTCAP